MDGNLLGLDIGTTGVKAVLIDVSGKTAATATHEYPLHTPLPNWAEQDPVDWWKATMAATKHVIEKSGVRAESILAVGLSGQMHSLVPLDGERNVIRPAILWCDTRTDLECQQITEDVGRDRLRSLVSNPALEGFTLPKILWMRNHEPDLYKRIATVVLPKDYIRFRLTDEIAMDVSDASGTLMFDVEHRRWSDELLSEVHVPREWLPPVVESVDVCGAVTREAASATGLRPGTPVVGGGADNTCGAVGTGVVREGLVLASIGTSGVVFAHSNCVRVEK
ncbi:MAG: FGGY family carbohydrate kinase, partial [Ignavibacteria bacterium]|nr:FGGY family carbohydrate kinase [Ignavibacteria bacterium]